MYTKSIDDDYSSTKSGYNPYTGGGSAGGGVDTLSAESATIAAGPMGAAGTGGSGGTTTGPTGVASWGTSFEKLLEDAAGLHTFSVSTLMLLCLSKCSLSLKLCLALSSRL